MDESPWSGASVTDCTTMKKINQTIKTSLLLDMCILCLCLSIISTHRLALLMTSPRPSHDMWHGRDRQPSPLRCSIYSHENSARNWNYPEDVSAIMCLHSSRDSARNWNHPEDVSTTRIELHSCHVVIHEHDAEHLGSITFTIALTAENIVVEDVLKALLPSVPNYEYFLFVVPSEDGEQTQFIFSFICRSCCLSQAHIPPFMRTRFGNSRVYVCLFS